MRAWMPFFVGLLTVADCSTGQRPRGALSGSLCVVTVQELRGSMATSLYDALRQVRPSFFRSNVRGEPPIVVLDGVVAGEDALTVLRAISASEVYSVRRLSAADATQRYGLHQNNGVLEVVTLRATNQDAASRDSGCS